LLAGASCSGEDEAGDPDVDPIAWVTPGPGADVPASEPIELSVKVNAEALVTSVRFEVDGKELATCDANTECRRGSFYRATTSFDQPGRRRLVATFASAGSPRSAVVEIDVVAKTASAPAPTPSTASDRGFLDPDLPRHNVFGGVFWSVASQRVEVESPPQASVTAVAACIQKYGASIRKHADAFEVSRASVVATAITESNCTNPSGSSDGLSSGPMQVTGSTCAAVDGSGISGDACKKKMFEDPDYSFFIGVKYMGSSYQRKQHGRDPPKISAAYNAGSIRSSTANRWHMVSTGNHVDRFVGAYNAYRAWESESGVARLSIELAAARRARSFFEGEHVARTADLPPHAEEGQVVFVGDWSARDGAFATFRDGHWETNGF